MANEPISVSSTQNQQIMAEMLMLAFHRQIPDYPLLSDNAKMRMFEVATGGLVAQVTTWILDGHKADVRIERREIYFPSSPWQFLKQEYAPKWFLRRWPVKMKETVYDYAEHHHFVCPHLKVEERNRHFMWMGQMSGQIK